MSDTPRGAVAALPVAGVETAANPGLWLTAATLWHRELQGFYRQRSRVFGTFSTPLLFWIVLGSGFGSSLAGSDGGYARFFYPGVLLLSVLFTSIYCNISLIEDRREGFLLGVLVAPVPRLSLVIGKVGGGATIGAIQGALMLPLAPLAGLRIDPAAVPGLLALLLLSALGITALGFLCTWWLNSVQGFHAIMNLVLMPMWLLSGAVFPVDGSSTWVRLVTAVNPMSYGVIELRRLLGETPPGAAVESAVPWLVLGGFAAAALLAAWHRSTTTNPEHLA